MPEQYAAGRVQRGSLGGRCNKRRSALGRRHRTRPPRAVNGARRRAWYHARGNRPCSQTPVRELFFQKLAGDLGEFAVAHPGWAGGFAGAAGEAEVKVFAGGGVRLAVLQHALDEVDASVS